MNSRVNDDIGLLVALIPLVILIAIVVIYWARRTYDILRQRHNRNSNVNLKTGSFDGYDPLAHLLESNPLGGVYLMPDGQAVPFLSASPISKSHAEDLDEAQTAVRFLMYAMDRDDWKYEFSEWEATLEDQLRQRSDALRRERLMRSLRVIPGGKTEDDPNE